MSKKLSPVEKESKLKVLQDCMDSMDNMMGEGLDKKKAARKMPKIEEKEDESEESLDVSPEESEEESDEMSEEELDAKIAELMAKKKKSPSA